MTDTPKAPRGLRAAGRRLWNDIAGEWDLRPDELRILADACNEADLIDRFESESKRLVELTTRGSQGQEVIHPLFSELRQHRMALSSLLRQLKLTEPEENEGSGAADGPRKPMSRSESARKAAEARWKVS